MYTAKAWLPGSEMFAAVNDKGLVGLLTVRGFRARGDWFLDSCVAKAGYMLIDDEQLQGDEASVKALADKLKHLYPDA